MSAGDDAGLRLRSEAFRRERVESWRELEGLIERIEDGGVRRLGRDELERLPVLYRSAVSSLSVARAISLDRNLLDYLTNLACRAYVAVYGTKRAPRGVLVEFLTRRLPRAVRAFWPHLAVSLACLVAGTLTGFALTVEDPDRFYSFIPAELASGRDPSATTEQLRATLYAGEEDAAGHALQLFATVLFTHNAKIGILCFTLGFAAGAPVVLLLFYNGLLLGAMAGLFHTRGLGAEFWAWVLPHGVTELLAICLCGMAGLAFGMAVAFPGEHARLDNLARRGRQAALAVVGAVLLLLVAAGIEGFFRQLVHDQGVRWSVALGTLALWAAYFGLAGRGGDR